LTCVFAISTVCLRSPRPRCRHRGRHPDRLATWPAPRRSAQCHRLLAAVHVSDCLWSSHLLSAPLED